MDTQTQFPKFKVKLDWKEYYRKFAQIHGGFPIVYQGQQLFGDGWRYSLTSYQGPEFEPPKDPKELNQLQNVYWYSRWNRARNELHMVNTRKTNLEDLQLNKSAPLQQVVVDKDEETGKTTVHTEDYDPTVYDWLIKFLQKEVAESTKRLEELKIEKEELHKKYPKETVDVSTV